MTVNEEILIGVLHTEEIEVKVIFMQFHMPI